MEVDGEKIKVSRTAKNGGKEMTMIVEKNKAMESYKGKKFWKRTEE